MFDSIAGDYDRLNHILSLDIDKSWRKKAVKVIADSRGPLDVLDVACGTGDFAIAIARAAAPGTRITGVDLSDGMLGIGREKVNAAGLGDIITMENGDCESSLRRRDIRQGIGGIRRQELRKSGAGACRDVPCAQTWRETGDTGAVCSGESRPEGSVQTLFSSHPPDCRRHGIRRQRGVQLSAGICPQVSKTGQIQTDDGIARIRGSKIRSLHIRNLQDVYRNQALAYRRNITNPRPASTAKRNVEMTSSGSCLSSALPERRHTCTRCTAKRGSVIT